MRIINFIANRKLLASLLLAFFAGGLNAQTLDSYIALSTNEVQGTARFSAMGGAFNALGGDFSTLSTNPAGIGVYRSSEFTFTSALTNNRTTNDYQGISSKDNRTKYGVANLGYIGTIKSGRDKGLVTFSYGIGYNKLMDFNKHSLVTSRDSKSSIIDGYIRNANDYFGEFKHINNDLLDGFDGYGATLPIHWNTTGALAADLIAYDATEDEFTSFALASGEKVNQTRYVTRNGNIGEYILSFGGNISNKVFFGATIGMQDLSFENITEHIETKSTGYLGSLYNIESYYVDGFGVNAKFGVIYKPMDALRIGFSVHTPTFYDIDEEYDTETHRVFYNANNQEDRGEFLPEYPNTYSYRLQTPYKIGFGLAYVFGKRGLLSVDYELTGYNSVRHRDSYDKDYARKTNQSLKTAYRNTSTIKIGAELNVVAGLSLRGGFNYIQSPYKLDAMALSQTAMASEPMRSKDGNFDRYVYSGGIGYKGKSFFADFAYSMNTGKYLYTMYDGGAGTPASEEKENRGRFLLTLGVKF